MIKGRCDCGGVTIAIPEAPDRINACPCSYCSAIGAHWAYFPPASVRVSGATDTYRREDMIIAFHRCATCGTLICWRADDAETPVMGVHMKLFPDGVRDGIPIVAEPPWSGD